MTNAVATSYMISGVAGITKFTSIPMLTESNLLNHRLPAFMMLLFSQSQDYHSAIDIALLGACSV